MIVALLLAAAAPSAVDAEYSFARDAQRIGQWTAFRKWADRDAVVFTPQAAWAQQLLPKKDPPKAIVWRPAHSFVSCDGRTAVNTGPWFKADGSSGGYFTTVCSAAPPVGAGSMTVGDRGPVLHRRQRKRRSTAPRA